VAPPVFKTALSPLVGDGRFDSFPSPPTQSCRNVTCSASCRAEHHTTRVRDQSPHPLPIQVTKMRSTRLRRGAVDCMCKVNGEYALWCLDALNCADDLSASPPWLLSSRPLRRRGASTRDRRSVASRIGKPASSRTSSRECTSPASGSWHRRHSPGRPYSASGSVGLRYGRSLSLAPARPPCGGAVISRARRGRTAPRRAAPPRTRGRSPRRSPGVHRCQ